MPADRSHAMDHVVVVPFENRSLDTMLGHLHGPEDGRTFEGVVGKHLSNPIPEWAEDGGERRLVPYSLATDMDSPNPDSGEAYQHTSAQLFGVLNEPMGYTPEQVPARNGLARGFGVFDRWFCAVSSQTLPNRSFWTAVTSSGFSLNHPAKNLAKGNTAETSFNRLDDHGETWKIRRRRAAADLGHGPGHSQRLKDHLVPGEHR
jgi:phospholipase C